MYSISSATEQKITDLAGNTVSTVMDDAAAATMTVETPFTSETYMYGEQAVAVYLARMIIISGRLSGDGDWWKRNTGYNTGKCEGNKTCIYFCG